ncbi:MAG: PaREP1 family protein [Candidatus Bipolaricaulia bacterium]
MKANSITLPQKLSAKLREKAEELGSLPEELAIEMLFKVLGEELDPAELAEHYRALSEKYRAEAEDFWDKRDLGQTSEKLWGAVSLTIKAVAAKRGLRLEKHGSLWEFISKLAEESEDKEIISSFHIANSLHRNFYENEMTEEAVEVAMEEVAKLIAKLEKKA